MLLLILLYHALGLEGTVKSLLDKSPGIARITWLGKNYTVSFFVALRRPPWQRMLSKTFLLTLRAGTHSSGIWTVGKLKTTQHVPLFCSLVNHKSWHLGWQCPINTNYEYPWHAGVRQDLPSIIVTLTGSVFEDDHLHRGRKMLARNSVSLWPLDSLHCPLAWFLFLVL